ncbi:hypothetical protein [Enhygromyxa salina]|uniref:Uncharacterized protein n=1 Tax=Enhygromyxa salina TaxID=215803 RepID=A0A2S9YS41_9BACT|nr:hypothetical protein [Enhygromyxa salina]PRQ07914.1 hypothetical protein ENSA7_23530 [Enhygromyxa salina]
MSEHNSSTGQLASIIHALPCDAAGFRKLADTLEDLEDEVSPHLDAFSSAALRYGASIDRDALITLFRRRRRDLELAILVLSTRLRSVPPRSIYPGNLLASFISNALGRRGSQPLSALLTALEQRDPAGWDRLVSSFAALSDASDGWRRWPEPKLARAAVDALAAVEQAWAASARDVRRTLTGGGNRERRRDPAFRRAVSWHASTLSLLERIAVPGGPLRLTIDYCLAVIAYFDTAIVNPQASVSANRAACDLLILEVFGMLAQFSLTDDTPDDSTPRTLEQGDTNRRKRIQRARLKVITQLQPTFDDFAWVDQIYPALLRTHRDGMNLSSLGSDTESDEVGGAAVLDISHSHALVHMAR